MTSQEYGDKITQINYLEGVGVITPTEAARRRYVAKVTQYV